MSLKDVYIFPLVGTKIMRYLDYIDIEYLFMQSTVVADVWFSSSLCIHVFRQMDFNKRVLT